MSPTPAETQLDSMARWQLLRAADAAYQRWSDSGRTDLVAARQGAAAYDRFFRSSRHPADVAYLAFVDACLQPSGTTIEERDALRATAHRVFDATVESMMTVCDAAAVERRRAAT